ncbi:MAG: DUF58 domain-containing protein [Thermoleophilia bacterium]
MGAAADARPTARGVLLIAAGLAGGLVARGFGTAALGPLAVGFVLLPLVAWALTAVAARGVTATRAIHPARPKAGEAVAAHVRMQGTSGARAALRVLDWRTDAGMGALGPTRAQVTRDGLTVRVAGARRGDHALPPLTVAMGDALGLAHCTRAFGRHEHVLVVPETRPSADTTGALGGRERGRLSVRGEDISSLEGLREYRPGDAMSRVHWGQSAKRGRLHTKVFRPEDGGGRVATVLLDTGSQAAARDEDRELAIVAAASVAHAVATGAGRAGSVGLWLSHEPAPHECGWAEAESRLARAVVVPAAQGFEVVLHRAARLLTPGGGLVAVTTDPPEAMWEAARAVRRAGIDLVVAVVGPHAVGAAVAPPGIPVLRAVDRDGLLVALTPEARSRTAARA